MDLYILSVLVSNHFGVLTRVTNLFSRRGYNIKALVVGETENPKYSRITIVTEGDQQLLMQIQKQLSKLYDVKSAVVLPFEESVSRELLLIKVKKCNELRQDITNIPFRVIEENDECVILEITGETCEINEYIEAMKKYGILELCRTGITALQKGSQNILKNLGGNLDGTDVL